MLILAFLGGILTILSPCILPIVPLVFSRSDRSFYREILPMLTGLAVIFAIVASVATASAAWIVTANEVGRLVALLVLFLVSLSLLVPRFAGWTMRPVARLGSNLDARASRTGGFLGNILVGSAIGLLWVPCAGPILGLIVAGAALNRATGSSVPLFVAFAFGAATSLGVVSFASGWALERLKAYRGADRWVRRSLGVVTIAGVMIIAAGWDRALFAKGGIIETSGAESFLIGTLGSAERGSGSLAIGKSIDEFVDNKSVMTLGDEGAAPGFEGGGLWFNSAPITMASLRGKVVMVEFWTYTCYNCLNALPYVNKLEAKYRDRGFVVVGVHTPEFPVEKVESNVRHQVKELGVVFPVVMDNGYRIWNSFGNQYWPAAYFIDTTGRIRFHHFGEGKYGEQDRVVASLLAEAKL